MAHDSHEHEHDHDHDHGHDHGHDHDHDAPLTDLDPAGQSLSRALQASFRLLSVIMVVIVVAFLLTGVKTIDPGKAGVITLLGKHVGVAKEGLVYTWPFPVGSIELVDTSLQELTVTDFWLAETAQDKTRPLSQRSAQSQGLIPGKDGALFTGDRGLLHAQIKCVYSVRDPVAYLQTGPDAAGIIRDSVCAAAIEAASTRTADGLMLAEQDQFKSDVRKAAQKRLDDLNSGLEISSISLEGKMTWPLLALSAYEAAQRAVSEAQRLETDARGDAVNMLMASAGGSFRRLVGEPWQQGTTTASAGEDYDLIGQYEQAFRAGDMAKAEQLLRRINDILVSSATGKVADVIGSAQAYQTSTVQQVRSRAKRFTELEKAYNENPQFLRQRLWAQTRDEILANPLIEKFYLTFGNDKTVLRIREPDIAEEIRRESLKVKTAEKTAPSQTSAAEQQ
jgi:membrane protease subunit HflK